ncbi:MAG: S8 family serine peptidase [Candidatus Paceibacterota bacterium]
MKKIHSRLMAENGSYADWHSDPVHKPVHWLAFLAVLVLVVVNLGNAMNSSYASPELEEASIFSTGPVPVAPADRYIVEFFPNETDVEAASDQLVEETTKKEKKHTYIKALKGFTATLTDEDVEELRKNPKVKSVNKDSIVRIATTIQEQAPWGLDSSDQRDGSYDGVYHYDSTGAGVNVYILDTGIRDTHVEFGGRVTNGFTSVNDGNGTSDCNQHGTHVAGIVGGTHVGVAKNVTLHSVRVLYCSGYGYLSEVLAGMDWIAQNRVFPAVVNISMYPDDATTGFNTAIDNLVKLGIVVVTAAGNQNVDACTDPRSPQAQAPLAITVGATRYSVKTSFSNWGPCLDLFAPGYGILSAVHGADTYYSSLSGTSMAAPHVAGVAALYLGQNPQATPAEVTQAILSQATQGILSNIVTSPNLLLYTGNLGVGSQPPSPPTASMFANPSFLTLGQSTTLTYWSTSATACSGSGAWSGVKYVPLRTNETVTPTTVGPQTYTLTCSGNGGTSSKSVIVDVYNSLPLPTLSFSATPQTINYPNFSSTGPNVSALKWSTTFATSCTSSFLYTIPGEGIIAVTPNATTTYTITCSNITGSVSKSVTVNVVSPPPTLSLSANPTSITSGQSSTLSWSSTNAASCTASGGWSGVKTTSGSELVAPTQTTSYTLSCTGTGGTVSQSATVTLPSPSGSVPLAIGVNVTTTSKVKIRATPSITGTILGQQGKGKTGVIVSGPVVVDSYTWWKVDFASGVDGWAASNYLK